MALFTTTTDADRFVAQIHCDDCQAEASKTEHADRSRARKRAKRLAEDAGFVWYDGGRTWVCPAYRIRRLPDKLEGWFGHLEALGNFVRRSEESVSSAHPDPLAGVFAGQTPDSSAFHPERLNNYEVLQCLEQFIALVRMRCPPQLTSPDDGLGRHRPCDARFCSSCWVACRYARLTKPTTVPPLHMPRKYTATKKKDRGAVIFRLKNMTVWFSWFWTIKTTIIATMTRRSTR
jgi:hypothetical protein